MDLTRPDRAERLDALAAEYALGTLPPRARRRLDTMARTQPAVAQAVRSWEYRLASLSEALPGMTPPPRVWSGVQRRLGIGDTRERRSLWSSVGLWRGLSLASFALAFVLAVAVLRPLDDRAAESLVVVLAGPDARPALIATAGRGSRTLLVRAVAPVAPEPGRALELWALPEGRDPQSLGVLPREGLARVTLPAAAGTALQTVPALAVSLEPAGGSPTGRPTGPVLYSGPVQRLY